MAKPASASRLVLFAAMAFLTAAWEDPREKLCDFNVDHGCTCVAGAEANTYEEVMCLDVKRFPRFKPIDGDAVVRTFVISGQIAEMPQSGLDMFARIDSLTIDRKTVGSTLGIQEGGKYVLVNCSIASLKLVAFPNFVRLTPLFGIIDKTTLAGLSSLTIEKSLSLSLFDDAFEGARNMKTLALPRNRLTDTSVLDLHPFQELAGTLTELDLSYNDLRNEKNERKVSNILKDLVNLQTLRLNANQLESLSGLNFSNFPKLELLDLNENEPLAEFEGSLFSDKHPSLVKLRLNRCGLDDVPRDALEQLPALRTLSLEGNKITNLTADCFSRNVLLESLVLDANPIQSVESKAFSELVSMKEFAVIEWDLDVLDLSVFGTQTGGVETLLVRDNHRLRTLTFSSDNTSIPSNLRLLKISDNNLTVIDESIGQLLSKDSYLFIQIANETHFNCPRIDRVVPSTTPVVIDTDNSSSSSSSGSNETDGTDETDHNQDRSLVWLAQKYVCEQRIQIASDVLCESTGERNSTEPEKLTDYLISLDPNCTGLVGTTTPPSPPSTPSPLTTNSSAGAPRRFFNSLILLFVGFLVSVAGK